MSADSATAVASASDLPVDGPADAGPTSTGSAGLRSGILGFAISPLLIIVLAVILQRYVSSSLASESTASQSSLDWSTRIRPQLEEHIWLTVYSTLLVLAIAIPLGIILTRPGARRFAGPVLVAANSGQSIPAYGLVVLFAAWLGTDFSTAVYALAVFAILPVLRNTMVGLDQVDRAIIEAGRGMGMSKLLVLWRIELPLAVPVILAGVRTALVINVGMAALAFLIGGGGLGETINSGLKLQRDLVTFTGAATVALVALTVDWLASVAERFLRPRGT